MQFRIWFTAKKTPSPIGGEGVQLMIRPPAKLVGGLMVPDYLLEKWRSKKGVYSNSQPLAHLMDDSQLYRIVRTVDDIANGGLGNAAFHMQLILRHFPLLQQF